MNAHFQVRVSIVIKKTSLSYEGEGAKMVREPISGKEELEFTPFVEQKLDDLILVKNHRVTEMQTTSFSLQGLLRPQPPSH